MSGSSVIWIIALGMTVVAVPVCSDVLTLEQAEKLALANANSIKALHTQQHEQAQRAVINSHLSAPTMQLGMENFPNEVLPAPPVTDPTTTRFMVDLKQPLPHLQLNQLQLQRDSLLVRAKAAQIRAEQARVLRAVRESWLNLYEIVQTDRLLTQQLRWLHQLGDNNSASPLVSHQLQMVETKLASAHAQWKHWHKQLGWWVGMAAAAQTLPKTLPAWSALPAPTTLQQALLKNPQLCAEGYFINACQQEIKLAQKHSDTGLNLSLGYGFEENFTLSEFSVESKLNLVTLRLTATLSDGGEKAQEGEINKSLQQLRTYQLQQQHDFLALNKALAQAYQEWQRYNQQVSACENKHLNKQLTLLKSTATMAALQRLNNHFEQAINCLQAQVKRAKTQVTVFYLLGE